MFQSYLTGIEIAVCAVLYIRGVEFQSYLTGIEIEHPQKETTPWKSSNRTLLELKFLILSVTRVSSLMFQSYLTGIEINKDSLQ